MTDASVWSSITFKDRVKCALQHLDEVYKDKKIENRKVNVYDEFMEANDMPWAEHNPTGDCMFLPDQFTRFFDIAQKSERSIYFAGEHLSRHHTWIAGALDSGRAAAHDVLDALQPAELKLPGWSGGPGYEQNYDPEGERKEFIKNGLTHFDDDLQKLKEHILLCISGKV